MKTKRDDTRKLIKEGKIKEALKLAKEFDKTYSKDELSILQIAHECLSGRESFYKQIGINTDKVNKDALILLERLFTDNKNTK